jgi:hypothetical protein
VTHNFETIEEERTVREITIAELNQMKENSTLHFHVTLQRFLTGVEE